MISIFVPALNEEKNLPLTLEAILHLSREVGVESEIIVIDDGSTDRTPDIIRGYARRYPQITPRFHARNRGIGNSFREALDLARFDRLGMLPGDNLVAHSTIRDLLVNHRSADVVLAYTVNVEYRSPVRRVLSALHNWLCRATFRLPLRYIHATPIYPTRYLRELDLRCERYSFPSEVTVKCLRSGCSFLELPGYMNPDQRRSSAVRFKNAWEAIKGYLFLTFEVFLRSRSKYRFLPEVRTFGTST